MEQIHIFLRLELERLHLTAAAAARAAGETDSQGLRDVLAGRKRLSADLLAALVVGAGVDALFVLTGRASPPAPEQVPTDEQMWRNCYRGWDADVKMRELTRALSVAKSGAHLGDITNGVTQTNSGSGIVQAGRDANGATINADTGSQTVDKSKSTAKVKGGFMNMAIGSIGRKK